jgi:hypothetical protein
LRELALGLLSAPSTPKVSGIGRNPALNIGSELSFFDFHEHFRL